MTYSDVAKKHGIKIHTINKWGADLKKGELLQKSNPDKFEHRRDAFMAEFAEMMHAVVKMNTKQANMLSDPEFIRNQTPSDLNVFSDGIIRRVERLHALTAGLPTAGNSAPANAPSTDPEIIDVEPDNG